MATAILSRLLLPSEYGIVALITVFTGFVMIFTDAGLSFDVIRSDYKYTYHKSISNLAFVMGLALFLLMSLLSYPIALFYDNMELIAPTIVLSSLFLIKTANIVPSSLLAKGLNFNYLGRIQFLGSLVSIFFMIIFAYFKFSYWALILPRLISAAFVYFFYSRKVNFRFRLFAFKYTIVGFRKARSIMGNLTSFNFINYWAGNADNLIIGKVYGEAALGLYNRAHLLLTLSNSLISGLFGKVLFPSLKKLQLEGGSIQEEYLNVLGIISLLNYPIALILIVFPETFVRILWGQNWMGVTEYLPYFGILILTKTLISTSGNIFILFRKENVLMYTGIVSSVIMVGAIVLGSFYSIIAVARFYTLSNLLLVLPIFLVYGFGRTFGFKPSQVISFWGPKLVLSLVILGSTWTYNYFLSIVAMFFYIVHLIYFQRNDFVKIFYFIKGEAISRIKNKLNFRKS